MFVILNGLLYLLALQVTICQLAVQLSRFVVIGTIMTFVNLEGT